MQNQNSDLHNKKRGERMNGSHRENKRKSTWVLICIELLCLPVTSFFYITSLKIQHLDWINLPANHDIISSECCCQYCSGGEAGFTLWSNKVQRHRRSSRDRDPGGSIKAPAPPNSNLKEWWTHITAWISRVRVQGICLKQEHQQMSG